MHAKDRPVGLLHNRFSHHGHHSGYAQIARFGRLAFEIHMIDLPVAPRGLRMMDEARRSLRATDPSRATLHLYSEQTLWRGSPREVAVCHQPASSYLTSRPSRWFLRRAFRRCAGLIALGPQQAVGLSTLNERVEFVPHGVDTTWFAPTTPDSEPKSAIVVHGWLRDQAAMDDLTRYLHAAGYDVTEIGGGAPRLTDRTYRDSLASADILAISVPNGVASNAVIEAMASGCAVVGHLSDDTTWYVSEENRRLVQLPPREQLQQSRETLIDIGQSNRRRGIDVLSWPKIIAQLSSATTQLLNATSP